MLGIGWFFCRRRSVDDAGRGKEALRLTETDASDERELQLSADGSVLFYLSDDGLQAKVMKAGIADASIFKPIAIATSERSKRSLRLSPDGGRLSWLEATGDVVTARLDGKEAKVVMRNWDMPTYDWSPDGNWLVVAAKDIHSNRDIWLVPANGSREPFNLTRHPAFEGSPKWSPDGSTIVFSAKREIDGLSRLWMIDVGNRLSNPSVGDEVLKEIAASVKRLETNVSEARRVAWSGDSKSIFYQSRDETDQYIHSISLNGESAKPFAAFRGIPGVGVAMVKPIGGAIVCRRYTTERNSEPLNFPSRWNRNAVCDCGWVFGKFGELWRSDFMIRR